MSISEVGPRDTTPLKRVRHRKFDSLNRVRQRKLDFRVPKQPASQRVRHRKFDSLNRVRHRKLDFGFPTNPQPGLGIPRRATEYSGFSVSLVYL